MTTRREMIERAIAHDDHGKSQEMCVRCGWVMGRPPLNCLNDDTAHMFPSQLYETMTDRAVEVLNRVHEADPTVLPALIAYRVPCNEVVADDPAVVVGVTEAERLLGRDVHAEARGSTADTLDAPPRFMVGLLGIVNGILGDRPEDQVAAVFDDDDVTLLRFKRYVDPKDKEAP